jgi:hypothetical protein
MSKETIDNLCIFLKLLYEQTKDKAVPVAISKIAMQFNLPYYSNLSSVLVSKGIIDKQGSNRLGFTWMWTSHTEPNRIMAEAILKECRNKCTPKKIDFDKTEKQPVNTTPSRFFNILINTNECDRIKSFEHKDDLRYICTVLTNGTDKVHCIFFKDKHSLVFNIIVDRLLHSKYEDHLTHIELNNFVLEGSIVTTKSFQFPK